MMMTMKVIYFYNEDERYIVRLTKDLYKLALHILNHRRVMGFYNDEIDVNQFIDHVCNNVDGEMAWSFLLMRSDKLPGLETIEIDSVKEVM